MNGYNNKICLKTLKTLKINFELIKAGRKLVFGGGMPETFLFGKKWCFLN